MKLAMLFAVVLAGVAAVPALADRSLSTNRMAPLIRVQALVSPEAAPETGARIAQLSSTMQIDAILSVMRDEGLVYGQTLEDDMFPDKGGSAWSASVAGIYDEATMKSVFDTALNRELGTVDPATFDVIEAFFASDRGQRILTLEIEARRALLNPDTEDAAKVHVEELASKNDPRLGLIRKFAETNDLIEMNVAGALNANLAFFQGMAAGGGFDGKMSEEQMLQTVWSQEPAIRGETETWLYPYLALAYQPLSDDDMQAYLAFSDMAEGKVLNAAVFAAFNVLFTDISGQLGRAAAEQMHGEDI